MSADNIKVLTEIETLLPPLTDEQLEGLEQAIIRTNGPNDALWLWGDILVDGHNRYRLCRKNDLPYETKQVWEDAETLDEVKFLMREAACHQRNIPPDKVSQMKVEMVEYKQEYEDMSRMEAVETVAKATGVTTRSIHRDLKKVDIVNRLAEPLKESDCIWKCGYETLLAIDKLSHDEQVAAIERAGYDAKLLTQEVKRMATVEGSSLYNAEKAAKEAEQEEQAEAERKRGLFDLAVESLAETTKRLRKIKSAHGIGDGSFNRVYVHLTKIDEAIAAWKRDSEKS